MPERAVGALHPQDPCSKPRGERQVASIASGALVLDQSDHGERGGAQGGHVLTAINHAPKLGAIGQATAAIASLDQLAQVAERALDRFTQPCLASETIE